MSLLRFAARTAFASHFVLDGVQDLTKPAERAPEAEAFTSKAVPLVQRVVPPAYSSSVPEQAETWVRISGILKIAGGAMFATGILRRLGALFLVPAALLDVAVAWPGKHAPQEEKQAARRDALTKVALLGGAVLAAQDLQGRPSLGWRAEQKQKLAAKQAAELGDKAGKMTRKAKKRAKKLAKEISR